MDAIVALRDQQLRIIERLNELSSDVRGQITGKDMDHSPVASPTAADWVAPSSETPQASFDVPQEALIYLGTAVKQELDLTSPKSHSQDLLPGAQLHAVLPTSVLRQRV